MAFIIAFGFGFTTIHTLFADLLDFIEIPWQPEWFFSLLAALIFLPFLGLLYGGIKVLFNIKTKVRVGLVIFLIWIASLFTLVGMSIYHAKDFMHWRTVHEYVELPFTHYDTLYVDIPQKYYKEGTLESVIDSFNHWEFKYHKKNNLKSRKHNHKWKQKWEDNTFEFSGDKPLLYFSKENKKKNIKLLLLPAVDKLHWTDDKNFGLDVYKDAAGNKRQSAYRHAQQISFNYSIKDSLLIIEPLQYTKNKKWNGEFLRLHFNLPEGKTIVFGRAFESEE
jgi:hypothetical protein